MKMGMYSIYDRQTAQYANPFFQPNEVAAIRMFRNEVNRASADNTLYLNPEDFDLYHLATVDTETGQVEAETAPRKIASANSQRKEI